MRHALAVLTVQLCSFAVLAPLARADDVTVTMTGTTNNFSIQNVIVQFASTDVPIKYYYCYPYNTGMGKPCSISNKYGSPPKNMNIQMCIPTSLSPAPTLDQSCSQLLETNSGSSCHTPNTDGGCAASGWRSYQPTCQWTTSGSTATWNWTVTYNSNGTYTISCSQQGFSNTTH